MTATGPAARDSNSKAGTKARKAPQTRRGGLEGRGSRWKVGRGWRVWLACWRRCFTIGDASHVAAMKAARPMLGAAKLLPAPLILVTSASLRAGPEGSAPAAVLSNSQDARPLPAITSPTILRCLHNTYPSLPSSLCCSQALALLLSHHPHHPHHPHRPLLP